MGTSSSQFKEAKFAELDASSAVGAFRTDGKLPYAASVLKEYKMTENMISMSSDNFTIKDTETDKSEFKVEGKVMTLHDKKKLFDSEHKQVGYMITKKLSAHSRRYICNMDDMVVAVLKKKSLVSLSAEVEAWVLNEPMKASDANSKEAKSRPADFLMAGNWRAKNFLIGNEKHEVYAKVQREGMNLRGLVGGQDTYVLQVAPHVDSALIVLFVVCLDEVYRDDDED